MRAPKAQQNNPNTTWTVNNYSSGQWPTGSRLNALGSIYDDEMVECLSRQLIEECQRYLKDVNDDSLANLLEVLSVIARQAGHNWQMPLYSNWKSIAPGSRNSYSYTSNQWYNSPGNPSQTTASTASGFGDSRHERMGRLVTMTESAYVLSAIREYENTWLSSKCRAERLSKWREEIKESEFLVEVTELSTNLAAMLD